MMKNKTFCSAAIYILALSSIWLPTLAADPVNIAAMSPILFPTIDEIESDYTQREKKIHAMLKAKDYDGLDKMADSLQASKEEYPNGVWKLDNYFSSFYSNKLPHELTDDEFLAVLDQVYAWIIDKPTSINARLAYAAIQIRYAWKARGGGFSHTVTQEGRELMVKREATALQTLKDARKLQTTSPCWYFLMLCIAKDQSQPRQYFEQMIQDAKQKYPSYKRVYFMLAYNLDERWGGNPGELEQYAATESQRRGGIAGDEIYAQFAWRMDALQWYTLDNFFSSLNFSWPKIKKGFIEIIRKNPGSLAANSEYCRLACMARDFQTARPLFALLKGRADEEVWRSRQNFLTMRNAAFAAK